MFPFSAWRTATLVSKGTPISIMVQTDTFFVPEDYVRAIVLYSACCSDEFVPADFPRWCH